MTNIEGQAGRKPSVLFIQDGARLHYAIPVALKRAGLLRALYAGWYNHRTPLARAMVALAKPGVPKIARRMQERHCAELAGCKIVDSKFTEMLANAIVRLLGWRRPLLRPLWALHRQKMLRLAQRLAAPEASLVAFGFSHCISARLARLLLRHGVLVVVDQPIATQREVLSQQRKNLACWPRWDSCSSMVPETTPSRIAEEELLKEVNLITCASEYVKTSLVAAGVPHEKVKIIPYPVDCTDFAFVDRSGRSGRVRVGFVGQVGLRKGAPWFLETAKLCDPTLVKFTMVGAVALTDFGRRQLEEQVELVGSVPRSQIADWLKRFDIFFFPSTCEGSAGAVMEAMATGLPAVTSPNSGSVVRDGVDGYIVDYDRPEIAAARIMKLARDDRVRLGMGRSAAARACEFDIDAYARAIEPVIRHLAR